MGDGKLTPLTTPTPLNRQPQNIAHVITSTIVELVQRKFTKRLLGCSKLSYADRLARLKLESLEVRRLQHDLILTYKILFGLTE